MTLVWCPHIYILIPSNLSTRFNCGDCKEGEVTIMVQKNVWFFIKLHRLIQYSPVNIFLESRRIFHQKPILNLTCHRVDKRLLNHIQCFVSILQSVQNRFDEWLMNLSIVPLKTSKRLRPKKMNDFLPLGENKNQKLRHNTQRTGVSKRINIRELCLYHKRTFKKQKTRSG